VSGVCTCPHCKPAVEAAVDNGPIVHAPVELPDQPRLFRVHSHNRPPQDCTLHPDGRMSMQAGAETLWSMVSFDDMRDMNWREARIEWDPPPLPAETVPEPSAAPVQESIGPA
jgi:hypothetical protein